MSLKDFVEVSVIQMPGFTLIQLIDGAKVLMLAVKLVDKKLVGTRDERTYLGYVYHVDNTAPNLPVGSGLGIEPEEKAYVNIIREGKSLTLHYRFGGVGMSYLGVPTSSESQTQFQMERIFTA